MCLEAGFAENDFVNATKKYLEQGHNQGLFLNDQDQDEDLSVKDQDKDKDFSSRTRTRTLNLSLRTP